MHSSDTSINRSNSSALEYPTEGYHLQFFHDTWLCQQRRPTHLRTCWKLCCMFQYWLWCTAHYAMTISLQTSSLCGAVITQSNIGFMLMLTEPSIGVRATARWIFSSKSQHQHLSTIYDRLCKQSRTSGLVSTTGVAQNNDQPQVQPDVAARSLPLDQSNAAQGDHCSADRWVLAVARCIAFKVPAGPPCACFLHACAHRAKYWSRGDGFSSESQHKPSSTI
jgi:hypothetical protein